LDAFLEPVLNFLLDPTDPTAWPDPEANPLGELARILKPLDVLGAVENELAELLLADKPHHRGDLPWKGAIATAPVDDVSTWTRQGIKRFVRLRYVFGTALRLLHVSSDEW